MFKKLIQNLTWDYEFISMGREILTKEEMDMIVAGDRTKIKHADKIMIPVGANLTDDDRKDLRECGLIVTHIDEMCEWIDQLSRSEIV